MACMHFLISEGVQDCYGDDSLDIMRIFQIALQCGSSLTKAGALASRHWSEQNPMLRVQDPGTARDACGAQGGPGSRGEAEQEGSLVGDRHRRSDCGPNAGAVLLSLPPASTRSSQSEGCAYFTC